MVPIEPVQLEYAPASPRRSRGIRKWVLIGGLVVLLWAGAEHAPTLVRRVRLSYVQNRVAAFEYPAGTVIYDSDPATMESLLQKYPGDYVKVTDTSVWPNVAVIRNEPAPWADLKRGLFNTRSFWPPGAPAPKALVHRLRNSAGEERLVAIILAPEPPSTTTDGPAAAGQLIMVSAIVLPGDLGQEPGWRGNGSTLRGDLSKSAKLRVFAAQLDPADPARFSIRYEMDGVPGTIEGRLGMDRDVALTMKDGPARITN